MRLLGDKTRLSSPDKSTDALVFCAAFVLLLPFFFIAIRLTAFQTLPFDDYTSFFLAMDGRLPSFEFYSPQGYRWAYFSLGFVLYKILPLLELSKMDGALSFEVLRANQALMAVSFVALHLFFCLTYYLVKNVLGKPLLLSLTTGFIVFFLSLPMAFYGIDPLTLAFTTLLLINLDKLMVFCPLLLLSIFVNEKIGLLFGAYFALSILFNKVDKALIIKSMVSTVAVALYFLERAYFAFPGYEYQTDITKFFERIAISLPMLVGLKGIYMNWLPLIILTVLSLAIGRAKLFDKDNILLSKSLIFQPSIFFILGMFTCSDYGIGRASLHTLPFFIAPLALLLEHYTANNLLKPNIA